MEGSEFLTDIYLPQMLYALTVRSPAAGGRLVSIECPKLPGSYTLIQAQNIPGKNRLGDTELPILAESQVSYIGEPVALLLGPDKNTLEEYLHQCKVTVEEADPPAEPVTAAKRDMCIGDPDGAFAQAETIVRGEYSSGIEEHWYAEPTGAIAWPDAETKGSLIIRTATQWPHHVKRSVVQALGLKAAAVQVQPTTSGLHMDGKFWYPSLIACHAALGALLTKKPVRLTLTRKDDFLFSPKRCATSIVIESALDAAGAVTALDIKASVNLGAYGVNSYEMLDNVSLGSAGVYKAKNIRFSGVALKTNIPPQGPFAGFGLAQGFFAIERHVSRIADSLTKDPAQWRIDNFSKAGVLPFGLPLKDETPAEQLITLTMHMSDYRRKWAAYELLRQSRKERQGQTQAADSQPLAWSGKGESLRGIGIALGYQANGLLHIGPDKGVSAVELTFEKDGSLDIRTSMANTGADCKNAWIDAAAAILSIDKKMIKISCAGSDAKPAYPDSGPAASSRAITVITRLVEQGCLSIQKKRFRDPLPISVRKSVHPQYNPAWGALFPQSVDHSGFMRPGWAAAAVEVEISPIEYLPRIRGVWMGVDGGRILAEDSARRSLKISAVQALGWAYRECISYNDGIIPADQFANFDIPSPHEVPPVTIDFLESNSGEPKGIGDLPFSCIPAAYAQAVSQAMDCHFDSIPLGALDIYKESLS